MEIYNDRLIRNSLGNFATYYCLSVEGIAGWPSHTVATLDDEGRFVSGKLEPTIQLRPRGPSIDADRKVITLMRELTSTAFPDGKLVIAEDGTLSRDAAR